MTARVALAVLAATITVLAGCSDDPASEPTGAPTNPPTLPAPATTTAGTTTSTTTTTATTTTTTTSSTAPTTPTTTSAPVASTPTPTLVTPEEITAAQQADRQLALDVERDWTEFNRLTRAAQMDPSSDAALTALLEFVDEPWTARTEAFILQMRTQNRRLLPEPLATPSVTIETAPSPVADTSDEVAITTCIVDPYVLVESGPDGVDIVVNDTLYAYRSEVHLRLVGSRWRVVLIQLIEEFEGVAACS